MSPTDTQPGRSSLMRLRGRCAVLFALAIGLYGVYCSFAGYAISPDVGGLSEEAALMKELEGRLVPLRDQLTIDQAYGYVSPDADDPARTSEQRYTMARYLLAPAVLFKDRGLPLLILDMPDDATLDVYVQEQDLTVIYRPEPAVAGVAIAARETP